MCEYHNVTPQKGDILFIHTGVITEWDSFTDQQKREYAELKTPEHAGVEASLELLSWLWDSGFSAVAGDAISWEVRCLLFLTSPSPASVALSCQHTDTTQVFPTPGEVSMHEYLLAGWGMPIGSSPLLLSLFLSPPSFPPHPLETKVETLKQSGHRRRSLILSPALRRNLRPRSLSPDLPGAKPLLIFHYLDAS